MLTLPPTLPRTDSRLANLTAKTIHSAYHDYQSQFEILTGRAQLYFEQRQWAKQRQNGVERLELYKEIVDPLVAQIHQILQERVHEKLIWASMKAVYSNLIEENTGCELAETFFNSVTRRIFTTIGVDPQIEFVATDFDIHQSGITAVYRTYDVQRDVSETIEQILQDYGLRVRFVDLGQDAQLIAQEILSQSGRPGQIEMARPVFFRGMGAYLVGRMVTAGQIIPLVLALLNTAEGLVVDGVLQSEEDASILFSFSRSYFQVQISHPYDLVQFLRTLMPRKRTAELYIAIGHNKHGKTELYRDVLRHLAQSDSQFEVARGQKGMVMTVFYMPDHDLVFKIIKDRFAQPKKSTRLEVKEKYAWVFRQDRAGRLVDAQEFEHLQFKRHHFSETLLSELLREASLTVEVTEEEVIIRHVYLERRVIPLDIYLREATPAEAEKAVLGYGQAIKDLAYTNVFTGDMLLKNFGVTRHGRVVFYDYDELCPLTDCKFRKLPPAKHFEDELEATPWFHVNEQDIFPEEFRHFMALPRPLMAVFEQEHGDLLDVHFWRQTQENITAGEFMHIYPYTRCHQLR